VQQADHQANARTPVPERLTVAGEMGLEQEKEKATHEINSSDGAEHRLE